MHVRLGLVPLFVAFALLLEVTTGARGQVVGNDKITDLPLDAET